jgi:hypothetical protein
MKHVNFYLVLIPIFFSNFIQAQNSPYQSECAKFEGKSSFQCSAYSNCRLMGGSMESCKSSSGSDKRFTDSQSEIDERKMLEKEKKDKQGLELQ